jgi:alpha 1,2-mannosyltransferase
MNTVIIYLAQTRRLDKLLRSLRLLQTNLLDAHPHPVVVFHEGDFTEEHLAQMCERCPSVQLSEVDISPPPHIDTSQFDQWALSHSHSIGYRNMCRFFSLGLYPRLEGFDYYMRLDDDSFIHSKMEEDPFEVMRAGNKVYAWRATRPESKSAVRGLKPFLRVHDKRFGAYQWDRKIFYNNFHIAKPSLWLTSPCKEALEAIEKNGGIYTKRWGDAPIHTLLVRVYTDIAQRHRFTSFDYQHGSYRWRIGK